MVWDQILVLIIVIVLTELTRPKPNVEDARPAGLGDFDIPTATEGRVVPLVWGRVISKGPNVVWYGDLKQNAIINTIKTGLWSRQDYVEAYQYQLGIHMGICRGGGDDCQIASIRIGEKYAFQGLTSGVARIDINEPNFFGAGFGNGGIESSVDVYPGSQTQPVNAYLNDNDRQRVASAITPTAPAYVGSCHLVARQLTNAAATAADDGAVLGTSTTIAPWHVEVQRHPSIFGGQVNGEQTIGGIDANPINVIYEILTNKEWGFGFEASAIDVGAGSSFCRASDTMISEGNGFSMLLTRPMRAKELMAEIGRQIDGSVYLDQATGKWTIQLVREEGHAFFGYDPNTVPEVTDSDIEEILEFTRGSWDDITNVVQIRFDKRSDAYKTSHGMAQNMASAIMLAGGSTTAPVAKVGILNFPGVKTGANASKLATRELRGRSNPMLRGEFIVSRKFYNVRIADVITWTSAREGFTKLPLRVARVDYGPLESTTMKIKWVEDIFGYQEGSMGEPPDSKWQPPDFALASYPVDQQLAYEAPRGIVIRSPDSTGDVTAARIHCAVRQQGSEVGFQITQRNSSGATSGSYAVDSDVVAFMRIGALDSNLAAGTAIPTATITLDATPDSQTNLEAAFDDSLTIKDLGTDLQHLIRVNDEFMLVSSAQDGAGTDVDLNNVYRGVLGTAQEDHTAGDDVYLVFLGAGLSKTTFPNDGHNVDIELRARSATTVRTGAVDKISIVTDQRAIQPYPPAASLYSGSATPFGTPDLEADGAGLNGVGFEIRWRRRRYDTTDEVAELLQDFAVDASTEYRVQVFVSAVQAFDSGWVTGPGPETPTQAEIVNEASAGTAIQIRIDARHDIGGITDLEAFKPLLHDVTPTSVRSSQFYLGGDKSQNIATNAYTVATTSTHNVTIGASYSTAVVERQINSGGWVSLIGTGLTTAAIALTSGDTFELRVTANEAPARNFVEIDDGTSDVAYGVFTDGS